MGQILHGCATTTEAVRRAIQNSQESLRALAKCYGINQKTVAKWKQRDTVADLPTGPEAVQLRGTRVPTCEVTRKGPGPSTIPRTTIMPSSRPQICTDSSISRDSRRISRSAIGISDRVVEFQDWLRHHRGISERTVDRHGRMVMRLLPRLGDDPAT
jgi:hypothetical protein